MVADEFRRVAFDLATACHLASEQVALECLNAQALPSNQLVPLAPRLCGLPMLVAVLLITRCGTQPMRQRAERRLECGKSGHTYNAKRRPSGRLVVRRRIAVALALNRCLSVETVRVGAYRRTHLETFVSLASGQMPSAQRLAIRIIGSSVERFLLTLSRSAQHLIQQGSDARRCLLRYQPAPSHHQWQQRHQES